MHYALSVLGTLVYLNSLAVEAFSFVQVSLGVQRAPKVEQGDCYATVLITPEPPFHC